MSMFLCTTAIPLEDFYPYGPDVGDSQVWLYGAINYRGRSIANYMEVFFIGLDNVGEAVWFRNSTSQNTKERALTDIQRVYPSVSYIDQILIVTWDRLHLLSQNYQVAG
ncbi:hypothetical protein GBAR_LOCUS24700 [Geodia barretti]|uniref:Uncharacterized protein n=1 Tax=Geodia barretti TaxID=519541 RepID=A0AA35X9N8_GEOBA|nr:hypothetical protein GBAR_LOCUS24700 [Geodia barretti]